MEYRALGTTGLDVSILGFGASPLGDVFGETSAKDREDAVRSAIDFGITLFDVSPYYGRGLAEERLGQLLVGRRERVVLATKCGRYGLDEFDFSASRVRQSCDESLRRLCTDHIDLFQVHDVEFGSLRQIVEETIPTLRDLQKEGKVRFVGVTGLQPAILLAIAEQQPVDAILNYCRYNLLNHDMEKELTPFARANKIGLINAAPFHMGVLTEDGAPAWHPAAPETRQAGDQIARLCAARGARITDVALQYCLKNTVVASTLVGQCRLEEVNRNVQAASETADPELLEEIEGIVANAGEGEYWPSDTTEVTQEIRRTAT